jgi:hypothetical protein
VLGAMEYKAETEESDTFDVICGQQMHRNDFSEFGLADENVIRSDN